MEKKIITILEGDGIGPEVTKQAEKLLLAIAEKEGFIFEIKRGLIGGGAYDNLGRPDPDETIELCKESHVVLLGAIGGPKWDRLEYEKRPERALLRLRADLGLFANLRPATLFSELVNASSLKEEVVVNSDIMIIRELTGGIYFGNPRGYRNIEGVREAFNTMVYNEKEIRRIAKVGFETARLRQKKLCSVDKANVLEVSDLWRQVVVEMSSEYPDVELSHLYIDNAVMQIIRDPNQFDTIVTSNLFGDILSDGASMVVGSIGLLPSASIGEKYSLYEPVHGTAPDIAGLDKANPLAAILSIGMMFQYTLELPSINQKIIKAVSEILKTYRTSDIIEEGKKLVGCRQMGDLVIEKLII